jgi:hypothetical protein
MLRRNFQELLAAARRPQGGPARSDSVVWGRSVQRSQGIACRPMRHRSRCLRPSKHRRGRSARKAAPAPKPVGAARSGRSVHVGVQPVSRLPGKQVSACRQVRSRGTPLQLPRSEVASVWRGRDHCGFGAIAPGKEWARFGTGRECSVADGTVEQDPQSPACTVCGSGRLQPLRKLNSQPSSDFYLTQSTFLAITNLRLVCSERCYSAFAGDE